MPTVEEWLQQSGSPIAHWSNPGESILEVGRDVAGELRKDAAAVRRFLEREMPAVMEAAELVGMALLASEFPVGTFAAPAAGRLLGRLATGAVRAKMAGAMQAEAQRVLDHKLRHLPFVNATVTVKR